MSTRKRTKETRLSQLLVIDRNQYKYKKKTLRAFKRRKKYLQHISGKKRKL